MRMVWNPGSCSDMDQLPGYFIADIIFQSVVNGAYNLVLIGRGCQKLCLLWIT